MELSNIAFPNVELASNLRSRYCKKLIESLESIFSDIETIYRTDVVKACRIRFHQDLSTASLNNNVFVWALLNYYLPDWLASKNESNDGVTSDELDSFLLEFFNLHTNKLTDDIGYFELRKQPSHEISTLLIRSFSRSPEWDQSSSDSLDHLQLVLRRELELYKRIDPIGCAETFEVTRTACLGHSESSIAASSFGTVGSIFLSTFYFGKNAKTEKIRDIPLFYLLDKWIHESAHNVLYMASVEEEFFQFDPTIRVQSPLREDPRPLDGVFHQCFVINRLIRFYEKVLISSSTFSDLANDQDLSEMNQEVIKYRTYLEQGLTEIGGRVEWNDTGKKLFDHMLECSRTISI